MAHSDYVLITILICALCTQVTRQLPFLLFGGKKGIPGLVRCLGTDLPAAIMVMLVVYCLRGTTPLARPYGLPELISVAVVVGLHLWEGNTLSNIALGTVCYMLLVQMVFWCCSNHVLVILSQYFWPYPVNILAVSCRYSG